MLEKLSDLGLWFRKTALHILFAVLCSCMELSTRIVIDHFTEQILDEPIARPRRFFKKALKDLVSYSLWSY